MIARNSLTILALTLLLGCETGADSDGSVAAGVTRETNMEKQIPDYSQTSDRSPKRVSQAGPITIYNRDAVVWAVNVGGPEHVSLDGVHYRADELVDGGEPGTFDEMAINIYETANPGNVVLDVPQQRLDGGNLQAHYDQPHR